MTDIWELKSWLMAYNIGNQVLKFLPLVRNINVVYLTGGKASICFICMFYNAS